MSEKKKVQPSTGEVKAAKIAATFAYRNIKKRFTNPVKNALLTKNYHLEKGENDSAVIVQDHDDDWFAMTQKDADKVGLANILEIARRRGEDPFDGRYAFKDEEALDLGDLDPMDIEGTKKALDVTKANNKLDSIAKQLGLSVDDLVDAFVKGTLTQVIESKTAAQNEKKEGKE